MELCFDTSCHAPAGWKCLNCAECVCELHLFPADHDCESLRGSKSDDEPTDDCDFGGGD